MRRAVVFASVCAIANLQTYPGMPSAPRVTVIGFPEGRILSQRYQIMSLLLFLTVCHPPWSKTVLPLGYLSFLLSRTLKIKNVYFVRA